ncbi:unnamed protein product [Cylindrotheca closterium]|uniref:Uncharacterized protein n=1 Tax=Cylindrotheca closterium TaxID=2856 RepID=A0AAD2CVT1_9STRA|nr:unnamed protein product [Cylindrotheca closterium]
MAPLAPKSKAPTKRFYFIVIVAIACTHIFDWSPSSYAFYSENTTSSGGGGSAQGHLSSKPQWNHRAAVEEKSQSKDTFEAGMSEQDVNLNADEEESQDEDSPSESKSEQDSDASLDSDEHDENQDQKQDGDSNQTQDESQSEGDANLDSDEHDKSEDANLNASSTDEGESQNNTTSTEDEDESQNNEGTIQSQAPSETPAEQDTGLNTTTSEVENGENQNDGIIQPQTNSSESPSELDTNGVNTPGPVEDGSHSELGSSTGTPSAIEKWKQLWRDNIPENATVNALPEPTASRILSLNHTLYGKSATQREVFTSLVDAFPLPKHEDSIAVYSEEAYNKLISKLLQTDKPDRKFKIVATGGSTTAGGGKPPVLDKDRYYSKLADYLNSMLSINQTGTQQTIEYIPQGHGTRNSLHAAVLLDNFIPSDTDLLLWEFSINDAADPDLKNKEAVLSTSKQSFIAWLHEISAMKEPPMVVLLYYWNSPYRRNRTTHEIICDSYESHGDIARQFPFVVGHLNMAKYVDEELNLSTCGLYRKCPLLSDQHHASRIGHVATAFLLLNVLNPWFASQSAAAAKQRTFLDDTKHEWTCGTETDAKRLLQSVITNSSTGWKSSIGSWTLEIPIYNQETPRSLVPGNPLEGIELISKASDIRQDRQRCISLNQCGANNTFYLKAPFEQPMRNVRVMLMSFRTKGLGRPLSTSEISVQLNDSNTSAPGELVPMMVYKKPEIVKEWHCHFSCSCAWGTNVDLYWYILNTSEPAVHSVRMCVPPRVNRSPKIQSLAFW